MKKSSNKDSRDQNKKIVFFIWLTVLRITLNTYRVVRVEFFYSSTGIDYTYKTKTCIHILKIYVFIQFYSVEPL